MGEKCFCHFNGYQVKDAAARKGVLTPAEFGAVGDGVADDTAALAAMFAKAKETGSAVRIPAGMYAISEGLIVTGVKKIDGEGTIVHKGSGDAITIGEAATSIELGSYNIRVENATDNRSGAGIKLINAYYCEVNAYADGFGTGLELRATNGIGVSYNTIYTAVLNDNVVGLRLINDSGGWVNQNVFIGGRIKKWSNSDFDGTGISIEGSYLNNSNVFVGFSVEMVKTAINMESGELNRFIELRVEGCSTLYHEKGSSSRNIITTTYESGATILESTKAGTVIEKNFYRRPANMRKIFAVYDLAKKVFTDGELNHAFKGMKQVGWYGVVDYTANTSLSVDGDFVKFKDSPNPFITIKAGTGDYFIKVLSKASNRGGRLVLRAFDADGNIIETNPFKGHTGTTPTAINIHGYKAYRTQVDNDYFWFRIDDPNVSKIIVEFAGGSNEIILSGFEIYADEKTGAYVMQDAGSPVLPGIPVSDNQSGEIVIKSDGSGAWIRCGDAWKTITIT